MAGNSFIYYKSCGHPERTWLDCFVVFGVDRDAVRNRGCYYTWKTGKAPDFVLEIRTSMRACGDDRESRRHLYSALGIAEYWIFDVTGAERGNRGLYGNRLVDGRYEEMALTTDAAGGVRGYSPTLGLSLVQDNDRLRFHDPAAGSGALNLADERAARLAVEAENRDLRDQVRHLRLQVQSSA